MTLVRRARTHILDIILFSAVTAALIVCCLLRSRDFPMWLDEIVAYHVITDGSFAHMLTALGDQADGGGPLYYILARLWAALFSQSELSLRMFSAVGLAVGFGIVWMLVRRYYDRWATAVAIGSVVAATNVIKFEVSNVRFYGLLLAAIALLCMAAARLNDLSARPGFPLLAFNTLAVGALILVHPLGVLYAGMVFLALVTAAVIDGRWSHLPRIAAAYFAGLLFLLLWLRQYIRLSDISKPTSWVPVPRLGEMFWTISYSWAIRALVLAILLIWLLQTIRSRRSREGDAADAGRSPFPLALALALCCIDGLFWVISVVLSSIYLDRYMIGVSIGLILALAELLRRLVPQPSLTNLSRALLVVVFVASLAEIAKTGPRRLRTYAAGKFDHTIGHGDLPIVCSSLHSFAPRVRYSDRPDRYFLLHDEWFARINPYEFKMAAALQKYYGQYYRQMVETAEFLRSHPKFVVLILYADPTEEFQKEGYDVTPIHTPAMPEGERFFLVEKRS